MTHHQEGEESHMPIYAINTAATKDYISELDTSRDENGKPLPEATIFKLGAMDSYIKSHVQSKATSLNIKDGVDIETLKGKSEAEIRDQMEFTADAYTMALQTVRFCLKGWTNFIGPKGKPIEFKTSHTSMGGRTYKVVDADLLGMMPTEIILELYSEIDDLSNLSEEESKN